MELDIGIGFHSIHVSTGIGLSANTGSSGGSITHRAITYEAETSTIQTAATNASAPFSESRLLRLNRAIARIKNCGAWNNLTALYLVGSNEAQWQINLRNPGTNDLIKSGTPTFTADVGATFSSTSNYYDTGLALNSFGQNNHCMMVETQGGSALSYEECGVEDTSTGGLSIYAWTSGNQITIRSFAGPTGLSDTGIADGKGWSGLNRSTSSNINVYHNGYLMQSVSKTSAATSTTTTVTIGKANGSANPSNRTIRGFYCGSSLSDAQHAEICAALTDYINCVVYGTPWIVEAGNGDDNISADVCVYGLSMAAVCAAYHAARRGLSVAMIGEASDETIWDIGGMPVNGLSWIDSNTPSIVGGVFRDMLSWIASVRGATDSSTQGNLSVEPRYWSLAVRRALDGNRTNGTLLHGQSGIKVYMGGGIDSVSKVGSRIDSIITNDGRIIKAKYFVSADYRGDLLHFANLPTQTGREAAGTGQEALNGYQASTARKPQFPSGTNLTIDSYVVAGDSSSGRLPDVAAMPNLTNGEADPAHQSMNLRLTVTVNKHLKAGVIGSYTSAPSNYSAARYERFGRLFAANTSYTETAFETRQLLNNSSDIWDVNNGSNFSTDVPGSGLAYANAGSDITQAIAIEQDVREYIIGLYYWIKNSGDSRIPATLKSSVGTYCMSALNHLDPGSNGFLYWPRKVYVREPTFMLKNSGFILNGNDVAMTDGTTPTSIKTIASINYRSDIHWLRCFDNNGSINIQGGINDDNAGGTDAIAPWPLEASLPDKINCENLCTPTAPSMTKVAWASARMEASMAAAGEVLAEVIYQATQNSNQALQDVNYSTVRTQILTADNTALNLPQTN